MKIAAVSEDGVNISQHFGRAPHYVVLTIEEGQIVADELRPKVGHHTFAGQGHSDPAPDGRHGCDAGSQTKHQLMAETIADCEVLIAGGMGWGAYESLRTRGIRPIVTDLTDIREAVLRLLRGELPDRMERLH
ncbi:MAG TPA: NifB/NifX family molybdenum-iron cluster-binding protein [Dehalococcoidia bacterium]|nr:NifB/NifX family molybdenum-iron cluster-binding protein [Dehalococcoidia bacterium]